MHQLSKYVFSINLGLILSLALNMHLQAQQLLTLEEAIQLGLENNLEIKIVSHKCQQAAHNHTMGHAGFLPKLDAHLAGELDQKHWDSQKNVRLNPGAGVTLEWTIFDGLGMFFTYKRLGKLHQLGEVEAKRVVEDQVAAMIAAYYGVVLAHKKEAVLQKSLQLAEERWQLAKVNYEIGKATQLDYLTAQVHYHADQSKLLAQKEALGEAKLHLGKLLGNAIQGDFTVVDTIPLDEALTWEGLTAALTTNNEELQVLQDCCDIAALELRSIKARRFPQLITNLGYHTWQEPGGWQHGPRAGLMLSINLFEGFNFFRETQNAQLTLASQQLALAAKELALEAELQQNFLRYTNQLQRCELEKQNLQVSQANAALALQQYRLGQLTSLAAKEAQQCAEEAEIRLLEVTYAAKKTAVALQRLVGKALPRH